MKGEHLIDDTEDAKDTVAKEKWNYWAEEKLKWKKNYQTVMFNIEFLRFHQKNVFLIF